MADKWILEALDRTLRDLTSCAQPFGGKVIVLAGDFRQTLFIIKGGGCGQMLGACLSRSTLWRHFQVFRLTMNMRTGGEQAFADWLLQLGEGKLQDAPDDIVPLPPHMCTGVNIRELIK